MINAPRTRLICWEFWVLSEAESRLLEKYKNIAFYDLDENATFTIHPDNLEFRRGRDGGWMLIGVAADENVEDGPFEIKQVFIDLIAKTEQTVNVTSIVHRDGETNSDSEEEA